MGEPDGNALNARFRAAGRARKRAASRRIGSRDIAETHERADEALREYARALKFWNAPDDEHTRYQLRGLVERAIKEEVDAA